MSDIKDTIKEQVAHSRVVLQHVVRREVRHAAALEDLGRGGREAALRELRRSLHVQHDAVVRDLLLDRVLDVVHGRLRVGSRVLAILLNALRRPRFNCEVRAKTTILALTPNYSFTAPVSPET